jgi:Family of unknown function (DUF5677)
MNLTDLRIMTELKNIRDKDHEIFKVIEEISPAILGFGKSKEFKHTSKSMLSLYVRLGFLKNGMLDVAETDNLYAFNVLFRAFLEHFLKANYIYMRWVIEKSDMTGENYQSLDVLEVYDYLKAWKWVSNKTDRELEASPKEKIKQLFPGTDNAKLKELDEIQKKFKYRQLIHSINSMLKDSDINILHKIVPVYSELSSFVHGGPYVDSLLAKYTSELERNQYLVETSDLTVVMFCSLVSWLCCMSAEIDNQYIWCMTKIDRAKQKYFSH